MSLPEVHDGGGVSRSLKACAAGERGRPRGLITPIIRATFGSTRGTVTSRLREGSGIEKRGTAPIPIPDSIRVICAGTCRTAHDQT